MEIADNGERLAGRRRSIWDVVERSANYACGAFLEALEHR